MKRYYRIAGLNVEMDSFGRIVEQAKPYQIEACEKVDIVIRSNWEKHREEQPHLTDSEGEYIFSGGCFYQRLMERDGIMLHSSAVVVDGYAYLFSANSGVGKSTHTQLWLKQFGNRAYILNDDKPALRLEDGKWYAYGTPWSGKYNISANERVPLAGIAVVERSDTNSIKSFSGAEAISAILTQVNRPGGAQYRIKLLELLDRLFKDIPIWKLHCNMDPEAALVSYEAMRPKCD